MFKEKKILIVLNTENCVYIILLYTLYKNKKNKLMILFLRVKVWKPNMERVSYNFRTKYNIEHFIITHDCFYFNGHCACLFVL